MAGVPSEEAPPPQPPLSPQHPLQAEVWTPGPGGIRVGGQALKTERLPAIVGGDIANIEAAAVTWRKWGSDATAAAVDEQRDRTMLLQMVQTIGPAPEEVTSTIICLDGGTQLMILFLYPAYPPFDKDDLAPHFFLSGFIPCNR